MVLIITSGRVSRIFFCGTAEGGLKKCEAYFSKLKKQ